MTELEDTSSKSNASIAALLRRGAPLIVVLLVACLAFAWWSHKPSKPKPSKISVEDMELVIRSSEDPLYQLPPASAPSIKIDTILAQPYTSWSRGCTDDCSGHDAGYEWAEEHDITDADDCTGNSQSFIEGCEERAEEHAAARLDDELSSENEAVEDLED